MPGYPGGSFAGDLGAQRARFRGLAPRGSLTCPSRSERPRRTSARQRPAGIHCVAESHQMTWSHSLGARFGKRRRVGHHHPLTLSEHGAFFLGGAEDDGLPQSSGRSISEGCHSTNRARTTCGRSGHDLPISSASNGAASLTRRWRWSAGAHAGEAGGDGVGGVPVEVGLDHVVAHLARGSTCRIPYCMSGSRSGPPARWCSLVRSRHMARHQLSRHGGQHGSSRRGGEAGLSAPPRSWMRYVASGIELALPLARAWVVD
jgi:hypothetical protein